MAAFDMEIPSSDPPPEPKGGLSSAEAARRLQQYGPNLLPEQRGDGLLLIFYRQFISPFIYVLLAAALVSFGLGQTLNGVFILVVLLINASIGTAQEYSAQRAAAALKKMVPQTAAVVRDGVTVTIAAADLVPGDLVLLVSGDKVPADLMLLECQQCLINESMLTGESQAADKHCDRPPPADAPLAERSDLAFAGTIVTHGRARGRVTATAAATEIGRIATQVEQGETIKAPLLQRIERFTLRISLSVLVVIILLFLITLLRGESLADVFLLGVALAVSAIPEGLPAAITVALAIGMRRMARVNVIVRKLVAVEALGSCTLISSDKTGTLTVNEMTAKSILLPNGDRFEVSGEGLDLHGEIQAATPASATRLLALVQAGLLANEASLSYDGSQWRPRGDGVDLAFLVLAAKYGFDLQHTGTRFPELARIPYESENAYSASTNRVDGHPRVHVKGSAERVLAMCSHSVDGPLRNEMIEDQVANLAQQGYRVLALASGQPDDTGASTDASTNTSTNDSTNDSTNTLASSTDHPPSGLCFLGLVGMIDPLRPEARPAIDRCKAAAIEVVMITGDHPQTALALARQLGIADNNTRPVSGNELAAAAAEGDDALQRLVASTTVFARIEPNQKLQIVEQQIRQGHFVAVTGDGVNDAPALRHAHVGIAMGRRGTDVARESAELILTDDHFASIVEGIRQGRVVYSNVRKVIFLLISTGAAEITLFILSVLSGLPIPLFPIQLLWLNLVTNGIQDVALAFEPAEGDELQRPPRPPRERIFNRLMLERVLVNAVVMGSIAFALFAGLLQQGMAVESARNMTLLLMVLFENVHVLNSRSETRSIFRQPFFGNPLLLIGMLTAQAIHIAALYTPGLSNVLQVEPVSLSQWINLLLIALTLILVDELHKGWHRHRRQPPPAR